MSTPGYNDGLWHHAVFVGRRGGRQACTSTAVQKASQPWTGPAGAATTTQDLHPGHYPGASGGAEYLAGSVDDVRIYSQALSAAEVVQLYDRHAARDTTPPVISAVSRDGHHRHERDHRLDHQRTGGLPGRIRADHRLRLRRRRLNPACVTAHSPGADRPDRGHAVPLPREVTGRGREPGRLGRLHFHHRRRPAFPVTCPATPVAPGASFNATVNGGSSARDWVASYVAGRAEQRGLASDRTNTCPSPGRRRVP